MSPKIKKILFIITQSEYGGAQRFLHTLVARLDPARYAVIVASGQTSDREDFLEKELSGLRIPFRRLIHLVRNPDPYHDLRAVYEIKKLLKECAPDTVFLLSTKAGFLASLAARLLPSMARPRVIYRIGGWSFNDPLPRWKRMLWRLLERISAYWKDIIIVNSAHDYDQARRLGFRPRQRFVLIHNGIDPFKITLLDRGDARERLGIPADAFVVGAIANFYKTKGLSFFSEAAQEFSGQKHMRFVVIGDGPERPATNNVQLAGTIPDAASLLKAFDIFVLPSVKEGFPWAVLEAMSAKIPVIATRVGAVPEIIENGKNGFMVEPSRPEQIASRIRELAASDHLRQEFGIQGHQTVLFKFSLNRMIEETERLL